MKAALEVKVGAFVFASLLIFGTSIILLGGDRSLLKSRYELYIDFDQVQGLVNGSVVSLMGMQVGNVNTIKFIGEKNKLRVYLKLDTEFQDRIREGTKAEIRTQGALGDKYIYLIPGEPNAAIIQDKQEIPALEGGDILAMISSKGDSIERVFESINELHKLMKAINGEGRSMAVMENMVASTQSLKTTLSGMQALINGPNGEGGDRSELHKSLKHLSNILRKIDQGEGTLGALINDPSLHENLKSMLGGSPRQRYLKNLARDAIQKSE